MAQYDGRPSRVLVARLTRTLALARDVAAAGAIAADAAASPLLITVGGNQPGDRFTEAGVAADWLRVRLRNPATIREVPEGMTLREELAAARAAVPEATDPVWRLIVVTDPLNVPRAWLTARAVGLRARVVGAPGPVRFPKPSWFRCLAHEAGGLVMLAADELAPAWAAQALRGALYRVEELLRPGWRSRHDLITRKP